MVEKRHFAGISRRVQDSDGQALQHFMSMSPWSGPAVFGQIQVDICEEEQLAHGSFLILDESADEKAGMRSAGASRQYNGRLGKIDECQVAVILGYANWHTEPWTTWAIVDSELFLPETWFHIRLRRATASRWCARGSSVPDEAGPGSGDDPSGETTRPAF